MNTPESTKTFSYGNSIIFFKKTATYIIKSNMSSCGVQTRDPKRRLKMSGNKDCQES